MSLRKILWSTNPWRLGLALGIFSVAGMSTYAQAAVDPASLANAVVTAAGKDTAAGVIWVTSMTTIAVMWFSWKQFSMTQDQIREQTRVSQAQVQEQIKVNQELATALTKFATKLDRAKCMAGEERA